MKLEQALYQWTGETLKQYFTLLGGKRLTRKADFVDYICRQMLDRETLSGIWQQLDPVAQRAVSSAYHNEGLFDTQAFVAQYGGLPPRPQLNRYPYSYQRTPVLFDLFVVDEQIPLDLIPLLTDLVLPPERFRLEGVEVLPETVTRGRAVYSVQLAETEMVGRADLLTFLQLVDQGALKWGAGNQQLTAGSVLKVFNQLVAGDFRPEPEKITGRHVIRPFGLDIFTQGSNLVTYGGKLSLVGRRYLHTQNPELFLEAFERWVEQGAFDELTRIDQLHGLNARGTSLTPPASRREKVIEALSWCPTHTWIDIQDFYRAIKIWHFDFDVEVTQWSNLYAGPYRDYGYMSSDDYWLLVHGLYVNAVIMEYLATIGAVDIAYVTEDASFIGASIDYIDRAYSLHDGLLYFRINSWGAFLLGQADEYVPTLLPQRDLFVIDEGLQLRVLTDLLPNERLQLEVMAEPVEGKVYLLSTEKLLTAVESGQEFDHLADFLTKHHHGMLPQTVIDWLAQLKSNVGIFAEGKTAVMIRLKDPRALTVIEHDTILSRLCRPLDSTTVLVLSSNLQKFRRRLKELGYLLG